jgi:hypothetical protein
MFLFHSPDIGHRETRCHLCLCEGKLSAEHVPPKSAYNNTRRVWERANPRSKGLDERGNKIGPEQTKSEIWQGGFYVRTLCGHCNNKTGRTSAASYVRFARDLADAPRLFDPHSGRRTVRVREDTTLLARQIAVMILAIEDLGFATKHGDLRQFALGGLASVMPPFKVLAFLVPNVSEAGAIVRSHARLDTYAPGCGLFAGEISLFPFGFVYAYKIQEAYRPGELADITHWFSQSGKIERNNAWLSAPVAVTVLDSMSCTLGSPRFGPQIDHLTRTRNIDGAG